MRKRTIIAFVICMFLMVPACVQAKEFSTIEESTRYIGSEVKKLNPRIEVENRYEGGLYPAQRILDIYSRCNDEKSREMKDCYAVGINRIYKGNEEWSKTTFYIKDKKEAAKFKRLMKDMPSIVSKAGVRKSDSAAVKVKKIYTFIAGRTRYGGSGFDSYRSYGAYYNRKAKCAGYARLFCWMCDEAGVPCHYITGRVSGGGTHAWNLVKIKGKWYYCDPTWDAFGAGRYKYFLKGSKTFMKGRTMGKTSKKQFGGLRISSSNYPTGNLNIWLPMSKRSAGRSGRILTVRWSRKGSAKGYKVIVSTGSRKIIRTYGRYTTRCRITLPGRSGRAKVSMQYKR